tara:strand:+ start:616 stop:1650 length:1035 start_codon:yes stop_codon:yes gene_type:complete
MTKVKINTHSPFQQLQKILVGQAWDEHYFDFIENKDLKLPLQQILNETNEDLEELKKILRHCNVEVFQPHPFTNETKYMSLDNPKALQYPPLQPRGEFLTLGNKCLQISTLPVWDYIHDMVDTAYYENQFNTCWEPNETVKIDGNYVSGANCIKLGDRIILPPDLDTRCREVYVEAWKKEGYKLIETKCNGHTDGVFTCLKPGVIVTLLDIQDYKTNFPGWDILYLPDQSWNKVSPFLDIKEKVGGRWWVPGLEENDIFIKFVNEWLKSWTGYVEETVFDVNMLSINEETVIVNNYNKVVFDFLKKHKIEPIIWKQRHRYFWDGGVHCLTVDLLREGQRENYFD